MNKPSQQSRTERIFERALWKSRFIVLIGVIAGVFGAFALFVFGTLEMATTIITNISNHDHHATAQIVSGIIGAVDMYLIGIVILLFSFGSYELFISAIDIGREESSSNILDIKSLDELKNKILKVVIMVLVVSFFKRMLEMEFHTALEMLYLAVSILALSLTSYFLRK